MQRSLLSNEETNYLRICNLILRIASVAVRVIFNREFDQTVLTTTLNREKRKILDLKRRGTIHQPQWDIMFPTLGTVSSDSFDLTLMICLIRHLTQIEVWDVLPVNPQDDSVSADLSRLKYYRNKISHCYAGVLIDSTFEEYWREITQAIVRLGGAGFRQRCDDLKVCRLDESDKEILIAIRNMDTSNDPVPIGIRELHKSTIEEWTKVSVAETRAIQRIEDLIQQVDMVMALGSLGCGKSTAIHHVALQLHKYKGYEIIPVYVPDEMRQCYNPGRKQVFVIDDIWGKSYVGIDLINSWKRISNDIKKMLEMSNIKILSSSRKYIHQDQVSEIFTFLSGLTCDLTSEYSLTIGERFNIGEMYLDTIELARVAKSSAFGKFLFFPLLCSLYKTQNSTDILGFFSYPVQIITDCLKSLLVVSDKLTATCMLFVIYNNNIPEELLKTIPGKEALKSISDLFHLQTILSFDSVMFDLDILVKESLVNKINSSYRLLYDEYFYILLQYLSENKLDIVLDVAHTCVIRDRFLFQSIKTTKLATDQICKLTKIPKEKEDRYFNRLFKDIHNGLLKNILLNTQMKEREFYMQFIHILSNRENLDDFYLPKDEDAWDFSDWIVFTINLGYYEMVSLWFKAFGDKFNVCSEIPPSVEAMQKWCHYGDKLLIQNYEFQVWNRTQTTHYRITNGKGNEYSCSKLGYFEIVKWVLNRVCFLSNYYKGRTSLSIALQKGYFDIVKLLLEHKAYFAEKNKDCLYILNEELKRKNKASGLPSKNKYVCTLKDVIIVKVSVFCRNDPHYRLSSNNLDETVFDYTEGLLNTLLMSLPDRWTNDFSENPVYNAAKSGSLFCLKRLLKKKADPNVLHMGQPPLFIAVLNGHYDAVKILLEYNADPNIQHWNETALHTAAKKGDVMIVKLLIDNNADQNVKGMFGIPMHIYVSNGNIHVEVKNLKKM